MTVIFYEDKDFTLSYTEYQNIYFLHCVYTDWKLSVYKKGLQAFKELHKKAIQEGITCFLSITNNPKFCQLFAGYPVDKVEHEGKEYEVYKWDLIQ